MVPIDCSPPILVVSDNRKGLILNAAGLAFSLGVGPRPNFRLTF